MKKIGLYFLSALFVLGGINHFIKPDFYLKIMPHYFPMPLFLVFISGLIEVLLGIMLLFAQYKKMAAWGIILLLISFFPVHINMIIHAEQWNEIPTAFLYVRILLQFLLIAWAYQYTKK